MKPGLRRIIVVIGIVVVILAVATTAAAAFIPPIHNAITQVAPAAGAVLPGSDLQFVYEGPTMEPTLHSGQLIKARAYDGSKPQRGDIVVFHPPFSQDELFVKRIIAIPGDTVEVHVNQVLVNGKIVVLPGSDSSQVTPVIIQPTTMGPDQYYVVGDNLANSTDSRTFGPISLSSIVGKVQV